MPLLRGLVACKDDMEVHARHNCADEHCDDEAGSNDG